MSNEIVRIPFNGTEIHTVLADGEPRVVIRPTLEGMGLNYSAQYKKLQTRSWATVSQTETVAEDGKTRSMTTVNLETWSMLLANIDENRVAPQQKQIVIDYQRESAGALRDYWTKGGAINTRATEVQLADLMTLAESRSRVLANLRGIVNDAWLESKARHVAAQALGEKPEDDPATRPLTVWEYLQERGVRKDSVLRSLSTRFGKRLSGLYLARNGVQPDKEDRWVGGALRAVACYCERDRPLFDEIWQHFAAEVAR